MIFNISSGGVAYISVTAPASTAVITATQGSLSFSRTGSGNITVPALGDWDVTCVYSGVTSTTKHVSLSSYGSTSNTISFVDDYTSTIHVTTFPGASVVATQTGHSNLTGTANSSGVCDLTVPADGLGSWTVTASFSSWSNSINTSVDEYGITKNITISLSVPSFTYVTSGQAAYTFNQNSSTGSNGDYYFYKSGANWEFYMKTSGTLSFTAATVIDLFLCGGGNNGVNATGYNTCPGGDGGKRRNISNITISGNNTVTVGSAGNDSSLYSYSSSSGTASKGSAASSQSAGENGGYCFNDSSAKGPDGNSRRVGAGGGHGAYAETDGTSQGTFKTDKTNGGTYGAGNGGGSKIDGSTWWCDNGDNATFYGAGGGGAGVYYHTSISNRRGKGNPGTGYKGFVAIRNKR